MIRFFVCLTLSVFLSSTAFAQEPQAVYGEIVKKPDSLLGEWVVAGKTLVANESTEFDSSEDASVGNLAEVKFVIEDSLAIITEFEAYKMRISDIGDGPHVMWKDEKTVEIISMSNGKVRRQLIDNILEPREIKNLSPMVDSIVVDPNSVTMGRAQKAVGHQ